tara:strand:+ start:746 stop:1234 length:489 start_codon:yes stop_codon:yes gene_type:complete
MIAGLGSLVTPVKADLTHRLTSSTQLTVDAGVTAVTRAPNTYSTTGSGVTTTITANGAAASNLGGITAVSASTGLATFAVPDAVQTTQGNSYSYTQSIGLGDSVAAAPTTGSVAAYSNQTSSAGGTVGNLAGTIATNGAMTLTGGGAGTSATGQFVSEITIR